MTPVRYRSFDDLEIPAYLTVPKSVENGLLPGILFVHGGPWARDYWGYNSFAQFFANRGYAVLQPNFRGSSGYGKTFLNAGNGEWGSKMQDDVTAGVKFLVDQAICDAGRIAIVGGSYGGYAALAGLTFTPDIYKCGVSIVGPSNLFTLLESIPPYWETVRKMFYLRLGDPETEEGRKSLTEKSPLFHADRIQAPLLVGQGNNDPRVKTPESDQIVRALYKHNLPVEYLNFPDEGHGFLRPENNLAFIAVMEQFLARHLHGRQQVEIPDVLADIIDRVTVDPGDLE
jgi:dipeptidyl aminopeptidase/acylaminoacyl peptidase